jgi:hypothetical protein
MTGYTVHTGTSKKFTKGWDSIFDKKKPAGKASGKKKAAKQPAAAKAKSGGKNKNKKKS